MKIGLALGVGGAKGFAHIGVIKVLEKYKIPIHMICGTSMGAIIGGVYALYKDATKLEKMVDEFFQEERWKHLGFSLFLKSQLPQPVRWVVEFIKEKYIYTKGLIKPYIINDTHIIPILESIFQDKEFKDTKLPFSVVALDLISGEDRIINQGKLVSAIRASISMIGIFPFVRDEKELLVDGGVTQSVPISPLQQLGAQVIIASSLISKLKEPPPLHTAFQVMLRADEVARHRLSMNYLKGADVVITPEVDEIHWADFSSYKETIEKGERATEKVIREIKEKISYWNRVKLKIKSIFSQKPILLK
jgi:NTE family protein